MRDEQTQPLVGSETSHGLLVVDEVSKKVVILLEKVQIPSPVSGASANSVPSMGTRTLGTRPEHRKTLLQFASLR